MIKLKCCETATLLWIWSVQTFLCAAGSAAVHSGAESFDERGAGGHSTGHLAKRRRICRGQDEEGGVQVSTF